MDDIYDFISKFSQRLDEVEEVWKTFYLCHFIFHVMIMHSQVKINAEK